MKNTDREHGPPSTLMRALTHRYATAAAVFIAATLITGVPLIGGLECLLSFLLASIIVTAYQRRNHARISDDRARPRPARVRHPRSQTDTATTPEHTQPDRPLSVPRKPQYEDEISSYGWPTRDALER